MTKLFKKFSVILLSSSILFSQSVYAARMGKSGNSGMQRSVNTSSYQKTNSTQSTNTVNNAGSNTSQSQQRNGFSGGTVAAAAAAGALGGYMMGRSSNHNASQVQSQAVESQFPWGVITILGLLLVIGMMMFRRRISPVGTMNNNPQAQTNNNFEIPNINNKNSAYVPGQYTNTTATSNTQTNNAQTNTVSINVPPVDVNAKMSDGVEVPYFLRQAKGMFLHIQSMNTPDNVSEIQKYMTVELYNELKSTISENNFVADFSQLDCRLLESIFDEALQSYIASVMFVGKVSESPDQPSVDFGEIWHFVKPKNNTKWLVAGIQQLNQVN